MRKILLATTMIAFALLTAAALAAARDVGPAPAATVLPYGSFRVAGALDGATRALVRGLKGLKPGKAPDLNAPKVKAVPLRRLNSADGVAPPRGGAAGQFGAAPSLRGSGRSPAPSQASNRSPGNLSTYDRVNVPESPSAGNLPPPGAQHDSTEAALRASGRSGRSGGPLPPPGNALSGSAGTIPPWGGVPNASASGRSSSATSVLNLSSRSGVSDGPLPPPGRAAPDGRASPRNSASQYDDAPSQPGGGASQYSEPPAKSAARRQSPAAQYDDAPSQPGGSASQYDVPPARSAARRQFPATENDSAPPRRGGGASQYNEPPARRPQAAATQYNEPPQAPAGARAGGAYDSTNLPFGRRALPPPGSTAPRAGFNPLTATATTGLPRQIPLVGQRPPRAGGGFGQAQGLVSRQAAPSRLPGGAATRQAGVRPAAATRTNVSPTRVARRGRPSQLKTKVALGVTAGTLVVVAGAAGVYGLERGDVIDMGPDVKDAFDDVDAAIGVAADEIEKGATAASNWVQQRLN